jgi:LacI family transcriptional regulator
MATARDVAALAGTSNAVVSYVFNNGPRGVSEATRAKVLAAAAQLDYHPNALARALSAGRTKSIGLIVPDICNPYFAELARAIEDVAASAGNLLLIADSALSPETEGRHRRSMIERKVDSVVVVSVSDDPDFASYVQEGIPCVALHPVRADSPASSLTIDYERAAAEATRHLLEHGYNSIWLLTAEHEGGGPQQHRDGFRSALVGSGASSGEWRSAISRLSASQVVGERLAVGEVPRAVYCTTDEQAFGVLHAVYAAGLRVPDDVAVIGFDGTANATVSIPPLTTVQQPREQYARRAMEVLGSGGEPVHETLAYEFVVRSSCGAH